MCITKIKSIRSSVKYGYASDKFGENNRNN